MVFTRERLMLLTVSDGTVSVGSSCPNRIVRTSNPTKNYTVPLLAPCTVAAGSTITVKITTAAGPQDSFHTANISVPVKSRSGTCASVSVPSCGPVPASGVAAPGATPTGTGSDASLVPVSTPASLPAATLAAAPRDVAGGDGGDSNPVVWRGVLRGNRKLYQYLHSALMLLSFGFLMPLGLLLPRHKWMFMRDPDTGKPDAAWFYLHICVQLLALLAGIGGVLIALLAFGWRSMPGQVLYSPHKYLGLAVIGMALLQLLAAPLRPPLGSSRRAPWNFAHHVWGRLTVAAGVANVFVGCLLVHDLSGEPWWYWLLPAALSVGLLALAALLLEAFKQQMQLTHRYNPKTQELTPIFEVSYHSPKRPALDHIPPQNTVHITASAAAAEAGEAPASPINGRAYGAKYDAGSARNTDTGAPRDQ